MRPDQVINVVAIRLEEEEEADDDGGETCTTPLHGLTMLKG